ncbi:MAG: hypothetical protein KDI55_00205 [Anaerolineae bacterium]|nr:hypothetical protein [Anaerolineae bacterium]
MDRDGLAVIVEATRFVAWAMEISCGLAALHFLLFLRRNPDRRVGQWERLIFMRGLVVKCVGWSLHQMYWWLWQISITRQMTGLKVTMEDWSALTVMPYLLIFIGEAMVQAPIARYLAGRNWVLFLAVVTTSLFLVGLTIATH